jgi:hypothetical protein
MKKPKLVKITKQLFRVKVMEQMGFMQKFQLSLKICKIVDSTRQILGCVLVASTQVKDYSQ